MEGQRFSDRKNSRFQREKSWFISRKTTTKAGFILVGILSTAWFLVRVIPKPSRANYPCMRVAAPFASAFVLYLAGALTTIFAARKIRSAFRNSRYLAGVGFIILLLFAFIFTLYHGNVTLFAKSPAFHEPPNQPVGIARGIYPGRVVWVWNHNATNENCTNTAGDYWWQNENTNQQVVDSMLSVAIRAQTGTTSDSLAWDAIFRHYNQTHGHGNTGYISGQKIAIKVNLTTGYLGNVDTSTYQKTSNIDAEDCAPQLILSLLNQLVHTVGAAQADISIGDPDRLFYEPFFGMIHSVFPDVRYLDRFGKYGRTRTVPTSAPVLFYSDGTISDSLPQAYLDASYMINLACLKQHDCAGGTFCAKNHFGSICREWSTHLHYSLPSPDATGTGNLGYGKYRCLVDLMEHKDLGEKTVLFMLDGIWGGPFPVAPPVKWQMMPFNNDWPNSLIISQDHVAIESVGFDFVRAEFPFFSHMDGADDYLHQAADSANWAPGIIYDPSHTGNLIASMGVHEHWNNDTDKQYTRNLGTGDGIELVQHLVTGIGGHAGNSSTCNLKCFPVPFTTQVAVSIPGRKAENKEKEVILYNTRMQVVAKLPWPENQEFLTIQRNKLPAGVYYLNVLSSDRSFAASAKLVVID
ncbi:MAG: DUF362 domain-containing protein [Bacteroidetes bacterium]|nr:DUF362 domain-containing protein [Bacteroidota bacterium]